MLSEKRVKLLDVDTPSQICIKASSINPSKHGIWCREEIKSGTKFGPYAGEKAYEVDEGMDPAYIWEIVDVETKEFLFYINASNPRHSNWMRYVNCARFLEEQNIVAQQEGIDIYYHAIKDIQPGEELLTWYEKTPVKKKKGKKKIEAIAVKRAQTGSEIKPIMRSSEISTRGRRRVVRKIWKEMNDTANEDEEMEETNEEEEKSENEEENEGEWNVPKVADVPSLQTSTTPIAFKQPHVSRVQATDAALKTNINRNEANLGSNVESSQNNASLFASGDKTTSCIYTANIITPVSSDAWQTTSEERLPMLMSLKLPHYSAKTNDLTSDPNKVSNPNEINDPQTSETTHHTTMLKSNMSSNPISTKAMTNKGGNFFSFEQMVESTPPSVLSFWKSGRKMFRCDICMGEYKHSFSLKRHYIRSHITFKYINRLDVVSCGVIAPKDIEKNSVVGAADSKESDEAIKNVVKNPQDINNSGVSDVSNERISMPGLYRCNICDRFFDLKSALQKHWGEHENNDNNAEKNFNCPSCNMSFRHKQNLVKHEVTHTGAKPFSCQKCHKTFPTATNQKRHERIHVGHRLTCYICSATFTQAGDLKKHTCKQHPESYNECAYCTKYFVTELSLANHLKETHGKDIEANKKRVCVKKKARKMLLERDRAESRRLALEEMQNKNRPNAQNVTAPEEETYACTACRKVFQNYSNMCRHRRLAHYRDGTEQPWNKLEEMFDESYFDDENNLKEDEVPNGGTGKPADKFESLQNYFFQVSGNIALNLENYLEGTQDQINNASNHIRWKQRTNGRLNGGRINGARPMTSPLCDLDLEELNFPTGFIIPEKLEYVPAAGKDDDVAATEKIVEDLHVDSINTFDNQSCLSLINEEKVVTSDKTSDTSPLDDINTIHDYSKKPQQMISSPLQVAAHRVDDGVLDLSKHIKCVYSDSTPPNFPCLVPPNDEEDKDDDDEKKQSNADCLVKPSLAVDTNNKNKISNKKANDASDKGKSDEKKFICLVCYQEFNSKLSVTDHQERQHSHVDSRHLEVDKDFVVTWIKTPNPIGQLNVTSSMLPLTEIEVEEAVGGIEPPPPSSSTSFLQSVLSTSTYINTPILDIPLTTSPSVTLSPQLQTTSEPIQSSSETREVGKEVEMADKLSNENLDTSALIVVPSDDTITQTFNSHFSVENSSLAQNLSMQETSPQVTSATTSPKKATKTCTKCRQSFSSRVELHKHISDECGDYWRNLKDRVSWVFVLRGTEIPAAQGSPDKKRVKYKGNGLMRTDGLVSEEVYKKQLQKILVQQHVGDDNGDGIMLSKSSGCSKVMTRRRSQEVGGAVVRAFDDPDYMVRARRRELIMNNAANRKTKGEPDSTPETGPSEAVTAEEEEEEDDGFEYDPLKHMCIYCRHQFLYIRTLRKHVVEFCHVRKDFKEKGELLDSEWEDGLQSTVIPSSNNVEANNDGEDGRKGSSGSIRKKRKRNWTSNKNNKNNKTPSKTKPIYSNQSSNTSSSHSPDILAPPSLEFCLNVSNTIKQLVESGVDSDKTTSEAKTFNNLTTPVIKTAPITLISDSDPIIKHPNMISNTFITTVTTIPTISTIPTIPTIITKKITTSTSSGDKIVSANSIRPIILVRSDNKNNVKIDTVVNDMKAPFDVISQQNILPQTESEVGGFEEKLIKGDKSKDDKDEEKEGEKEEGGSEIKKTRKRRGPRLTMVKRKKTAL